MAWLNSAYYHLFSTVTQIVGFWYCCCHLVWLDSKTKNRHLSLTKYMISMWWKKINFSCIRAILAEITNISPMITLTKLINIDTLALAFLSSSVSYGIHNHPYCFHFHQTITWKWGDPLRLGTHTEKTETYLELLWYRSKLYWHQSLVHEPLYKDTIQSRQNYCYVLAHTMGNSQIDLNNLYI